jgi:hypothetical protein
MKPSASALGVPLAERCEPARQRRRVALGVPLLLA